MSISDPFYVMQRKVWLWPIGFSLESYKTVFNDPSIWTSYLNTIWYVVVGTGINLILTLTAAFALSRKIFFARKTITVFITLTMFFSGGLIPDFLLINNLGLYNTRWALVLPVSKLTTYYILVAITFFNTIPESILESAKIDGANDIRVFLSIMLPLSTPIIVVLVLFHAVSHWNSYFYAMIYLADDHLKPLQLYLYRILVKNNYKLMDGIRDNYRRTMISAQLRHTVIMVASIPIICTYPFLQKYFIKGVMIGAVKA